MHVVKKTTDHKYISVVAWENWILADLKIWFLYAYATALRNRKSFSPKQHGNVFYFYLPFKSSLGYLPPKNHVM